MRVKARWVFALACLTVVLHIAQISWYYAPQTSQRGTSSRPGNALQHGQAVASLELLVVTATQPAPCTTLHGDHMVQLALKNKWQYASRHGYGTWASTELLSPWDLGGQWNKVALLSVLSEEGCTAVRGARWLLWVDDDAIFVDMNFTMPLQRYEAAGIDLVLWGDDAMTYEQGDSEGVNTGTMLLRISDWGRALLRAWAALASSPLRDSLRNHDQGGLVQIAIDHGVTNAMFAAKNSVIIEVQSAAYDTISVPNGKNFVLSFVRSSGHLPVKMGEQSSAAKSILESHGVSLAALANASKPDSCALQVDCALTQAMDHCWGSEDTCGLHRAKAFNSVELYVDIGRIRTALEVGLLCVHHSWRSRGDAPPVALEADGTPLP